MDKYQDRYSIVQEIDRIQKQQSKVWVSHSFDLKQLGRDRRRDVIMELDGKDFVQTKKVDDDIKVALSEKGKLWIKKYDPGTREMPHGKHMAIALEEDWKDGLKRSPKSATIDHKIEQWAKRNPWIIALVVLVIGVILIFLKGA